MARVKRAMRLLLLLPLAAYGALLVLALFSDRIIFQPQPSSYRDSDLKRAAPDMQIVKLHSGNAILTALYWPNPEAQYTLLFSHGNAEDLGDDLPLLGMLRDAGFAVFAYDYRGYGTSQGRASEAAVYEDVAAAYDYLVQQQGLAPSRIISIGRSLGSAAAIDLAARRPVAGLVLEAPFLTAFRVLTRVPLVPWDKFRNDKKIREVHSPVLVIQGRADLVVPWSHGERIYQLANAPKTSLWIENAGHNDVMFIAGKKYFEALRSFASQLRAPPPQR